MSFTFNFNVNQTRQILKGNKEADAWHQALVDILPKWKINTPERVAAFMAQCAHESNNFTVLEENLNYSWQGLRKTFPRYFPSDSIAQQYHRQPEKIANRVYDDANRSSKLGNTQPGDGWKYRGRGIIQLTGKNNYLAFAADVGMTLDQVVEYVQTKDGAVESAAWFWSKRNINVPADQGNIDQVSKLVNGGTIGLEERRQKYASSLQILNENAPASTQPTKQSTADLKKGSRGPEVVKLQQALKVKADGIFGTGTETSLKLWQANNGLPATGVATPEVMKRLVK
jgi:putative chitinase